MSVIPAALSVTPSGTFDGDDGNWSSFTIRIGTPPQDVRVLVSTLIPETWVILSGGCTLNDPSTCQNSRGGLFTPSDSTSWKSNGTWTLGEEENLDASYASDPGEYGLDTLGFELEGDAEGGVLLNGQVIAGIVTDDFYIGTLGLAPRTPSFGNNTRPSLLESLKDQGYIPSLSYGYTAGAYYQNQTEGSLTFGGYDASRFIPNDVSFSLGNIDTRDLLVGLQSITFSNSTTHDQPLLPYGNGVLAFIDSTLPEIWLPVNACDAFAQYFGLEFNQIHLYYGINETMHEANVKSNASVTFQLGNYVTGGATAEITLPYASFDLNSTALIAGNTTRYFPLRQALQDDQYTLGRAFLQEAYITVNYESSRQNFSVSQVDFSGKKPHIVSISSANTTSAGGGGGTTSSSTPTAITVVSSSSGLGTSAIAGIAIGIIAIAILLAAAVIFVLCRRKRRRRREAEGPVHELPTGDHKSPINEQYYMPHSKSGYGHDAKPSVSTSETQGELEGRAISSPQSPYSATLVGPVEELPAEDIRAELHSPEPPDIPVSPQSGNSRSDLPIQSHHVIHSPDVGSYSPTLDSTTSAFQSPRIDVTRFGMITPEPLSPGSGSAVLTPESENDHYNFGSGGQTRH